MPTVSVIVPVYKVEKFIAATIESILNQTFSDLEVIVVDDESPDRSAEICRQYKDDRIKIISQKNRGLAGARNTGIRHAQGKFIALLDSDDLWAATKLEKHLHHLEQNPEVGISFSRSAFIDEEGNFLGTYQMPKLKDIDVPHLMCRNPIGNGSAPVIRREVFDAIQFTETLYEEPEVFYFDDRFRQSEDIECWIRIALQTNWKIEGIPEALTYYRVNSGGLSANLWKQLESWERVIAKTRTYAPEVVNQWENLARAYQLRYLARRAIRNKDGEQAMSLVNRALWTHWQILLQEPRRTLLTLIAAYLLRFVPRGLYDRIELFALSVTGKNQKKVIETDSN